MATPTAKPAAGPALSPLDPASIPIDGRSRKDRLAFIARYTQLIWYINARNERDGDWQDFFVKDPAILLALIGKTDYAALLSSFLQVERALVTGNYAQNGATMVMRLGLLLAQIAKTLDGWYRQMSRNRNPGSAYEVLRTKIADDLSVPFWIAMLVLPKSSGNDGEEAAELSASLSPLWLPGKTTACQWLADNPVDHPKAEELVKQGYHLLFDALVQIVDLANSQFETMANAQCDYPETALVHAFTELMEIVQQQINSYGKAHLDFYFRQILLQQPRGAVADKVIACITLDDQGKSLSVPAGTVFEAGTAADGTPIRFANQSEEPISAAAIAGAYTINNGDAGWSVTQIPQPDAILYDATGSERDWPVFGAPNGAVVERAVIFASPLLLLQSGTRTVTLTLTIGGGNVGALPQPKCLLSTAGGWYEVPGVTPINNLGITFKLDPSAPAIVPLSPASGPASPWPQLKLAWSDHINDADIGSLDGVEIAVAVEGMAGIATTSNPTIPPQPGKALAFGPLPEVGAAFDVWLPECLSKPVTSFTITIPWVNLPPSFANYYTEYNKYLAAEGSNEIPFGNTCFTGTWSVLSGGSWLACQAPQGTVSVFQQGVYTTPSNEPGNLPQSTFAIAVPQPIVGSTSPAFTPAPLLQTSPVAPPLQATDGYLRFTLGTPTYGFGQTLYAPVVSYVALQNAQKLISQAKPAADQNPLADIIRIIEGLASAELAPALKILEAAKPIVSAATGTADKTEDNSKTKLILQPPPPFVPVQSGPSIGYSAVDTHTLASGGKGYPLNVYHQGPLGSAPVWTSAGGKQAGGDLLPGSNTGDPAATPLIPRSKWPGALFVALAGASQPGPLSIYLEVTPAVYETPCRSLDYWYLGSDGWKCLEVLSDETLGLQQSGILRINVPRLPVPLVPPVPMPALGPPVPAGVLWLAITLPDGSANTGSTRLRTINTQAIRLTRMAPLPASGCPELAPLSIVVPPLKGISSVVQPFASSGGVPAENDNFQGPDSFYRRVARRLHNKDRVCSATDYVALAHEACSDLYYAKLVMEQPGQLRLDVVPRYADPLRPDAFRPCLDSSDLLGITECLASRATPNMQITTVNFRQQPITIQCTVVIASTYQQAAMLSQINQRIRLYLAPWVDGGFPAMDLAQGLRRADLLAMLMSIPGVLRADIGAISWIKGGSSSSVPPSDPILPAEGYIFVPVAENNIDLASTIMGRPQ